MPDEILTQEEVQELPLWARCCWFIQGWKKPFMPKSIEEWAEEVGFAATIDWLKPEKEKAVKVAIRKVQCLLKFTSNIAAQAAQNTLDALQKKKTFQRYLEAEELVWPGWYWWLPEAHREFSHRKECWQIEYWIPDTLDCPKNGLFVGPLEPPVSGEEEKPGLRVEYTPKICP